jgi:nitrogen-specific signal transduction histidine kinase/CheY-like chemotaxis protein
MLQGYLGGNKCQKSHQKKLKKFIQARATVLFDNSGKAISVNGINIDITKEYLLEKERKKEQQASLIQSKLAAIGELAAGVGHEINNPLAISVGNLEKLKNLYNLKDNKQIQNIEVAHERIKTITDGLRTLSRTDTEGEVFDLKSAIQESLLFVKDIYNSYGVDIILNLKGDKDLFVFGNKAEIQQVLMNLFSNAKDATENKKIRKIEVTLESINNSAIVMVKDNGDGISKENQDKIFESFFTTKEVGKGTGIGLSISNQIISNHGGDLLFESELDKGATFKMKIPLTNESITEPLPIVETDDSLIDSNLSILIAEDEEGIRDIFEFMFEDLGCKFEIVEDGEKALNKLKDNSVKYDLVISDVQMPIMTGYELLINLREDKSIQQPKFVFLTGGVNIDLSVNNTDITNLCSGFIRKPFTEKSLIQKINSIFK